MHSQYFLFWFICIITFNEIIQSFWSCCFWSGTHLACLHDQNKSGGSAGFYPANQSNLKSIQRSQIGWKKASPLKKQLLFWSCKQATSNYWLNCCRLGLRWHKLACFYNIMQDFIKLSAPKLRLRNMIKNYK